MTGQTYFIVTFIESFFCISIGLWLSNNRVFHFILWLLVSAVHGGKIKLLLNLLWKKQLIMNQTCMKDDQIQNSLHIWYTFWIRSMLTFWIKCSVTRRVCVSVSECKWIRIRTSTVLIQNVGFAVYIPFQISLLCIISAACNISVSLKLKLPVSQTLLLSIRPYSVKPSKN